MPDGLIKRSRRSGPHPESAKVAAESYDDRIDPVVLVKSGKVFIHGIVSSYKTRTLM